MGVDVRVRVDEHERVEGLEEAVAKLLGHAGFPGRRVGPAVPPICQAGRAVASRAPHAMRGWAQVVSGSSSRRNDSQCCAAAALVVLAVQQHAQHSGTQDHALFQPAGKQLVPELDAIVGAVQPAVPMRLVRAGRLDHFQRSCIAAPAVGTSSTAGRRAHRDPCRAAAFSGGTSLANAPAAVASNCKASLATISLRTARLRLAIQQIGLHGNHNFDGRQRSLQRVRPRPANKPAPACARAGWSA